MLYRTVKVKVYLEKQIVEYCKSIADCSSIAILFTSIANNPGNCNLSEFRSSCLSLIVEGVFT